jgi:hypothetical protein
MFELQARDFYFAIIGLASITFINDPIRELQALMPRTLFWILSAFRDRGVLGPTSEMSPRAPAQMGRRETEREGGRQPEGDGRERWNPAAFVFVPHPGRVRLQ